MKTYEGAGQAGIVKAKRVDSKNPLPQVVRLNRQASVSGENSVQHDVCRISSVSDAEVSGDEVDRHGGAKERARVAPFVAMVLQIRELSAASTIGELK